jgi:hypothetical protein
MNLMILADIKSKHIAGFNMVYIIVILLTVLQLLEFVFAFSYFCSFLCMSDTRFEAIKFVTC